MSPDTLSDRIALQDVMLDYATGVDERDLALYRSCFAEDVRVIGFGDSTHTGRDNWVDYVWNALERYSSTQHLLGPQHATINGDTAYTRTDVQATHFLIEGGQRFTLWATYKTDMRREDRRWVISRHELVVRGFSTD